MLSHPSNLTFSSSNRKLDKEERHTLSSLKPNLLLLLTTESRIRKTDIVSHPWNLIFSSSCNRKMDKNIERSLLSLEPKLLFFLLL